MPPPLSLEDLKELLPAIACGEAEMTDAVLLQLVESTLPFAGPDGWDEDEWLVWQEQWLNAWIHHAKPEWLDVLIRILSKPEAWWTEFLRGRGELWLDCLEQWLIAIATKDLEVSLRKLGDAMLTTPARLRPHLITAVGTLGDPRGLEILDRFLTMESQPPDQIEALAVALADLGGGESLRRLTTLAAALDEGRQCQGAPYLVTKAREEVRRQLTRLEHST